jgi:aminomethyltransferase
VEEGARLVDFAGWDMPLHYGSQLEEHRAVRRAVGVFDVSHMGIVDLAGRGAKDLLRRLLANDVARLVGPGQGLYTCMLNPSGGVLDDLIVYDRGPSGYRLVVNAATRGGDFDWIRQHARGRGVSVCERGDLAMLAVQGPDARAAAHRVLVPEFAERVEVLHRFDAAWDGELFVARTGYTGEDGYEVILPAGEASALWARLRREGASPAGLGARDTLRLEAGLNLYGADMDEAVSPLECGLAWTVAWNPPERAFVGREALEAERARGAGRVRVGLVLEAPGVLRAGQRVRADPGGEGVVTSGGFGPTLGRSIALARLASAAPARVAVEVRGRWLPARVVAPPFVRQGRPSV